jgi:hypothetical protein
MFLGDGRVGRRGIDLTAAVIPTKGAPMRTHVRSLAAGAAVAAAFWLAAGPGGAQGGKAAFKKFLPADAYKELVTRTAKAIEAGLAKGDEDSLKRAQAQAAMVAGYTLSVKDAPGDAAGVRAAALDLAKIATNKAKIDQAKKLAANLVAMKGEPGAKEPADGLGKHPEDLGDLMNLFKPLPKGGEGLAPALQSNLRLKGALNGVEEKIRELAKKPLKPDRVGTEAPELVLLAYKAAVMAELTEQYPAPRKAGADPKDWNRISEQTRDASLELAAAAQKKDADAIFKAGNKLNSSCNQCHSVFR